MTKENITLNLPKFSDINIETIKEDLKKILDKNTKAIDTLLEQKHFTWDNLMQPIDNLGDDLSIFWSPISHLNSVMNSPELRKAYNNCLPLLSDYSTKIGHNKKLFDAIESIVNSDNFNTLDTAQKKALEHNIRGLKLSGIALPEAEKKKFAELSKQQSSLTAKFEENVLDATQGWIKHITIEKELDGVPDSAKQAAKQAAANKKMSGWVFTLEAPSYIPIMMYADNQELRKEMYHAYVTRASDQGPNAGKWDNTKVMHDILKNRLTLSKLLGFKNHAEKSLATKMVKKTDDVLNFLNELVDSSLPQAQKEFDGLVEFASIKYNVKKLEPWDIGYYSEKLRVERYNISDEELRPYFPEPHVVQGLFNIVNKLFQVTIKKVNDVDVWHDDVSCYALYNDDGSLRSYVYFDLYARENKRGGAWMDEFCSRRKLDDGSIQIPVAYVTCNFRGPVGDQPALFKHDDVVTLFHEFGHALQHMLTKVDYADVSGINGIPWDAVEIASQFLENWAWDNESLGLIAQHYKTKEPLPDDLYDRMIQAKNFQSAMGMVRQLEFSLFDFELHLMFDEKQENQVQKILTDVRKRVSVVPTPEFNRFQHGFSHIFAGGYAAGYYSYKWAEVMAADAFSLFIENGIFDRDTSQRFCQTFMESGGAIEPSELFRKFSGRDPKVESLLKQTGILSE